MINFEAKTGITRDAAIANIQAALDKATPAMIVQGATWYPDAKAIAEEMVGKYCATVEHAVWVLSAMSPRMFWVQNVKAALHFAMTGERLPGLMQRSYNKALEQNGKDILDFDTLAKSGKTPAFAKNILGDTAAVTIDVWAARVAGIGEKELNRVGVYDAVADCYREVAVKNGITAPVLQAVTWIVIRNGRAG